jgi:hypothetical protein
VVPQVRHGVSKFCRPGIRFHRAEPRFFPIRPVIFWVGNGFRRAVPVFHGTEPRFHAVKQGNRRAGQGFQGQEHLSRAKEPESHTMESESGLTEPEHHGAEHRPPDGDSRPGKARFHPRRIFSSAEHNGDPRGRNRKGVNPCARAHEWIGARVEPRPPKFGRAELPLGPVCRQKQARASRASPALTLLADPPRNLLRSRRVARDGDARQRRPY